MFLPRALGAVAVEPFAFGVVGQAAQHVHFQPVLQKTFHNVVDAEILRPEMLCYDKDALGHQYFLHTILLTTPV